MKNIVTIGGGTGHPVTLAALRQIPNIDIKAIVTTLDDGGSSGRLKREFDIEDCPVELVWMKKDGELTGSSTRMQTVGVKFGDLDLSQGAKLYYLLSNFKYTFSVHLFRECLLM